VPVLYLVLDDAVELVRTRVFRRGAVPEPISGRTAST